MGDRETKEKIRRMRIGDKMDSDHHPVKVWLEEKIEKTKKGKREKK